MYRCHGEVQDILAHIYGGNGCRLNAVLRYVGSVPGDHDCELQKSSSCDLVCQMDSSLLYTRIRRVDRPAI